VLKNACRAWTEILAIKELWQAEKRDHRFSLREQYQAMTHHSLLTSTQIELRMLFLLTNGSRCFSWIQRLGEKFFGRDGFRGKELFL